MPRARRNSSTVSASPKLHPRLRFGIGEEDAFGPGKAELLRRIAAGGSIRAAATAMAMSYNRAWVLVRAMNRQFAGPLTTAARGGSAGGGATLTVLGRKVLTRYERMDHSCRLATRTDWRALRRLLR
jgi:molybdate transport system regulatory protein